MARQHLKTIAVLLALAAASTDAFGPKDFEVDVSSSYCAIKLYKYDGGDTWEKLEGRSNEDLKLKKFKKMPYAKFYQTYGTCCWEVFKRRRMRNRKTLVSQPTNPREPTRSHHAIRSVMRVDCMK